MTRLDQGVRRGQRASGNVKIPGPQTHDERYPVTRQAPEAKEGTPHGKPTCTLHRPAAPTARPSGVWVLRDRHRTQELGAGRVCLPWYEAAHGRRTDPVVYWVRSVAGGWETVTFQAKHTQCPLKDAPDVPNTRPPEPQKAGLGRSQAREAR